MQSNLHSKEITTAQVASVSFGFFNDDEVQPHACNAQHLPARATAAGCCSSQGRRYAVKAAGSGRLGHPASRRRCRQPAGAASASRRRQPPIHTHCAVLQVRKISVKQVVSPIIFDNLKTAVRGGLYDPAYGPMDPKER